MKTISIIGVPSDFGANKPGSRFAPTKIKNVLIPWLIKKKIHYIDYGNVDVPTTHIQKKGKTKNIKQLQATCQKFLKVKHCSLDQCFPIILGGDHSIVSCVFGEISYQKKLGLIWFDAHGDFNTPKISPSGNVHGMVLNDISRGTLHSLLHMKGRLVKEKNIVLFGVRDLDPDEDKLLEKSKITIFSMKKIRKMGLQKALKQALNKVSKGTDGFHISFDIDVIDPSAAPGVSTPVKGGLTKTQALAIMKTLASV